MSLFCGEVPYSWVVTETSFTQRDDKLISGQNSGPQLELQASGILLSKPETYRGCHRRWQEFLSYIIDKMGDEKWTGTQEM